ncbi:hypothetical protein [Flavobacterium sp. N502540]|uniref:hypothetical protein n=1 Tax=Flavobacterium sp. N502540 TaxID=2986838 RepID=UPI0022254F28|nr:hypothetical protein [Flavobacterium sp. N502540]
MLRINIIPVFVAFFFVFNLSAQNNNYGVVKNKIKGKEIVTELIKLNFFNLTDKSDLKAAKVEFEKSYDKLFYFEGTMRENLTFTDNRFYFIDSETLFEGGGLIQYLEVVKPLFDKLNLKLDVSDEFSSQTEKHWRHTIKLNGKEYVAFDNDFDGNDWGIAFVNFIEMLNNVLRFQNSKEQFYPISSGNDGRIVLLTLEQFEFVTSHYPNNNEHPRTIKDWKKDYFLN